jgi:hypothetical protein
MTELATSNSSHMGQAMPTLSNVVAILSATAPQIGQSMSCLPLIEMQNNADGGLRAPAYVPLPMQRVMCLSSQLYPQCYPQQQAGLATNLSFS